MTSRLTFQPGRHTYKIDGIQVPSVTQLLKQLDKPALVRWASNTAADYATDNWAALEHVQPSERRKLIAGSPWASRDRAAAAGTAIHALAEMLLAGQPVEVPEPLTNKVQGLARWIEGSGVTVLLAEVRVYSDPDPELGLVGYAGTLDTIVKHPQLGVGLLDWKTGSGIYTEAALQVAAYAAAEWMVDKETDTDLRMPSIEWLGAVHIRDDGATLHTLSGEDRHAAGQRFDLLRLLANVEEPTWRQEISA